jgi:hypothetical protein
MGSQSQCKTAKAPCRFRAILGDKWMLFLFPLITLTLFKLGIIGFWVLRGFVLPWLNDVLPVSGVA